MLRPASSFPFVSLSLYTAFHYSPRCAPAFFHPRSLHLVFVVLSLLLLSCSLLASYRSPPRRLFPPVQHRRRRSVPSHYLLFFPISHHPSYVFLYLVSSPLSSFSLSFLRHSPHACAPSPSLTFFLDQHPAAYYRDQHSFPYYRPPLFVFFVLSILASSLFVLSLFLLVTFFLLSVTSIYYFDTSVFDMSLFTINNTCIHSTALSLCNRMVANATICIFPTACTTAVSGRDGSWERVGIRR